MAENQILTVINAYTKELKKLINSASGWKDDERIIKLYRANYRLIYQYVHNDLAKAGTKGAELLLREIIAKHCVGYTDNSKKKPITHIGAISPIRAKIEQIAKSNNVNKEIISQYVELYDDYMALCAFRSYKHYCLYMQSCFGFTLWEDTQNVFEGYWFYANRMVLDGTVQFLEKQLPTGFGKSISDAFHHAYIFGVDIEADVLKVCGNDKFTDDCFQNVCDKQMLSHKYAKIFPYYAQFHCKKEEMFVFCSRNELKFSIRGSHKSTNLRIVTKLSDVNGVRAKYLFLDDITQRRDMANIKQHDADIHAFQHEWFERNYNRNNFYVVASGTTYSQFDLLSFLKRVMGGNEAQQTKINKYTHISKSNYIVPNGICVFVCVPLLDYDTDESTYPKKISTQSARKKREANPTEFWAMDMQRPLPPDDSPFYFTKLREYEVLPKIGECGREGFCFAALDPKRRGKDFLSMPIFALAQDPDNPKQNVFYLVDWLYDNRPMKELVPLIINKIIQHNVTQFYTERNTDELLEPIITKELKEQGFTGCVIDETYSTVPKETRIMMAEGEIKTQMIFPKMGIYAPSNDIGRALHTLYNYIYGNSKIHDDAPDSLALFAKKFINKKRKRLAEIVGFSR